MDESEVRRRLASGEVSPDDQCWCEDWNEWRRIGDEFATPSSSEGKKRPPLIWNIYPRTIESPEDSNEPLDADIVQAKSKVGSTEIGDVVMSGWGCGGALLALLLFPYIVLVAGSSGSVGFGFLFGLAAVAAIIATFVYSGINSRKSDFESGIIREVTARRETEMNSFRQAVALEESQVAAANQDCRDIVIQHAPESLTRLTEMKLQAEQSVSSAEALFAEGAFTPFWDTVDQTVGILKSFDRGVGSVSDLSSRYYGLLEGREHTFPPFPVTRGSIPDTKLVFDRLEAIIARAHRDYQFTQIYEQRKTTSAVIAGFGSLNQAISHLRSDIVRSLDDLKDSVETGLDGVRRGISSLEASQNQNAEMLRETLDRQHRESMDFQNQDSEKLRSTLDQQHRKDRAAHEKQAERDKRFQQQTDETLRGIEKNSDPGRRS